MEVFGILGGEEDFKGLGSGSGCLQHEGKAFSSNAVPHRPSRQCRGHILPYDDLAIVMDVPKGASIDLLFVRRANDSFRDLVEPIATGYTFGTGSMAA